VPEYDSDQTRQVFRGPSRLIDHIVSDAIDMLAVLHEAQNALPDDED